MPAAVKRRGEQVDVGTLLSESLPPIFQQVQKTIANHRKNSVALHKVQVKCAKHVERTERGNKLVGEKAFNDAFVDMFDRALPIKKGVAVADRVIKFVAVFVAYTQEQFAAEIKGTADNQEEDDDDEDEETPGTRFAEYLLRHILKAFGAKDKTVRYRACLATAFIVNAVGGMDDDTYKQLSAALLLRLHDKEASVRVQAAISLAKMVGVGDAEEEEDTVRIKRALIDALQHDSSGDVRRAVVYNISFSPNNLPYLLSRARDVDTLTRKATYAALAVAHQTPLALDGEQRKAIVMHGLRDRELSVKNAAQKVLTGWIDAFEGDALKFLDLFSLDDEGKAAELALVSAFELRPHVADTIPFSDGFWTSLTPHKAFAARVFFDFCLKTKDEERLDETLPLVTLLAFRLQAEYNALTEEAEGEGAKGANGADGDLTNEDHEIIVKELLSIAMIADYGDEIGRRRMFNLVREMLADPALSEALLPACLDVLLKLSAGEKDFMRMVVEIVQDLRDMDTVGEELEPGRTPGRGPPAESNRPTSEKDQAIIDIRCLAIVQAMLERVVGALAENTAVHGLIPQLISPAVLSKDVGLREQGLVCLGLCCLLDKQLARRNFRLFPPQAIEGPLEIRLRALQIVFDLLIAHGTEFLMGAQNSEQLCGFLMHALEDEDGEALAITCEGIAKLMLSGALDDPQVLEQMEELYKSPDTADNAKVRQCLSYFIPVYTELLEMRDQPQNSETL